MNDKRKNNKKHELLVGSDRSRSYDPVCDPTILQRSCSPRDKNMGLQQDRIVYDPTILRAILRSYTDPDRIKILLRSCSFFICRIVGSYDPTIRIAILTTLIQIAYSKLQICLNPNTKVKTYLSNRNKLISSFRESLGLLIFSAYLLMF